MSALHARFRRLAGLLVFVAIGLAACGDTGGGVRSGGQSYRLNEVSVHEFDDAWDEYIDTADYYQGEILGYVANFPQLDELDNGEILDYTAWLCADAELYNLSASSALDDLQIMIYEDTGLDYWTSDLQPLASAASMYVCYI
jgi:hypothetical protein